MLLPTSAQIIKSVFHVFSVTVDINICRKEGELNVDTQVKEGDTSVIVCIICFSNVYSKIHYLTSYYFSPL